MGVVDVYLLAVVVFKLVPADRGPESEASSNPAHNFGFVPCVVVDKVKLKVLKLLGADGVAFHCEC